VTRPCDMLPPVKGSIIRDAALKEMLWFRAGGSADVLFRPADAEDLAMFLAARPRELPEPVAAAFAPAPRRWMPPWLVPPPRPGLPDWNSCVACPARWAEHCA
jgi:hypothetical protein